MLILIGDEDSGCRPRSLLNAVVLPRRRRRRRRGNFYVGDNNNRNSGHARVTVWYLAVAAVVNSLVLSSCLVGAWMITTPSLNAPTCLLTSTTATSQVLFPSSNRRRRRRRFLPILTSTTGCDRSLSLTPTIRWKRNCYCNTRTAVMMRAHGSTNPSTVSSSSSSTPPSLPSPDDERAIVVVDTLTSLAQTLLALLAGDESAALTLCGTAAEKKRLVEQTFKAYDTCQSGTLSVDEARSLFIDLAKSIVTEIAHSSSSPTSTDTSGGGGQAAKSHARRVLDEDERGTHTIERVATKLLILADTDCDGKVDLHELASMFDTVQKATTTTTTGSSGSITPRGAEKQVDTFPQPLRALAGSLQLLPPTQGTQAEDAANMTSEWNIGVPGDDHTLRRVELEKGLSIVGLGRSADASAYFLPELGIVLDAGLHVKSLHPKTVLLTHGHRDHTGALPVHASARAKILVPRPIAGLVRKLLIAEAQLNFGNPRQTDEETIEALGEFDVVPVSDGEEIMLPPSCYTGSPQPLGVQVFKAPHKDGVPAVSYGLYRRKTRLKPQYASMPKSELGALIRNDVPITESYNQGILFYTGDTTINLLRDRYEEILPKYPHVIHEVTFLGQPSSELDESALRKGHTHYSQLHPWICAFPRTTFVCVHWSLRYSREDVLEFFQQQYGGVPKNVVLWI